MADLHLDIRNDDGLGRRAALEVALREAIRSGRLTAGAVLPSSRVAAAQFGVSRSTVVGAYEQLVAEGYLVAEHGSATRVTAARHEPATEPEADMFGPIPLHDFRPGEPDPSSFPRARWLQSVKRAIGEAPDSTFGYPDPRGVPALRGVLADHLARTRSVAASAAAVRIVGGFGAGIGFLGETLRNRGVTRIGVEDPMLPFHAGVLRLTGLDVVPIPLDDEGIDLSRLHAADVGAVLVTPAHQYPTGITMTPERRRDLVGWAQDHDAWIIEDDYDGEFRYDRRPVGALQGLAPDRVVYAGTASKSLAPALRLAWLVVPEALRHDLTHTIHVRSGVSALDQSVLADFVERGDLDRHVRQMRNRYRDRSAALRATIAEAAPWLDLGNDAAGLHVMALIDPADAAGGAVDELSILAAADAASVGLFGLQTHHRSAAVGQGFAIGFSRPPEHHFPAALDRLGDVLAAVEI